MNDSPEKNTAVHTAAGAETTGETQTPTKRSAASRLGAYLGDLLISAGKQLKKRSYQERVQRNRTQRQIDVIKII